MTARGPNSLNLANYTQGQGQQIIYDPIQMSQLNQQQGIDMQQQFDAYVKDIQKYDQILARVAKSIDQISAQQYFITDFYPQFVLNCTYQNDHQKRIIADTDIELAKVVDNLQKNNRNLKQEIKGWLFQYAKKTRLSQVLLTENKLLRKYVSTKNKDIVKLINSIINADNQQLNSLKQDLNQLKQENGVLIDHLKATKQTLKQKQDQQHKIILAYQKAQQDKLDIQNKIKIGQDQQQHYSKMVTLLQASLQDAGRRQKKLLEQKQRLLKIKKQYQNDHQQIQKQIDNCKIDRQDIDKHLKAKFKNHQTEKQALIQEIQDYTQKVKKIKDQSRTYQQEISKYQHRIDQYTIICNDLDKKYNQIQINMKKTEQDHKKLKQNQIEHLSAIDMINYDIQVLKQQLKDLQEIQQRNKQKYKRQIRQFEQTKKNQVAKYNDELSKTQWKISRTIMQQKSDLAVKKKQIDEWQSKISEKKQQIQDLKLQMIQIKENQALMANLKQKLRDAQKK